jgi:hypothetical protein
MTRRPSIETALDVGAAVAVIVMALTLRHAGKAYIGGAP